MPMLFTWLSQMGSTAVVTEKSWRCVEDGDYWSVGVREEIYKSVEQILPGISTNQGASARPTATEQSEERGPTLRTKRHCSGIWSGWDDLYRSNSKIVTSGADAEISAFFGEPLIALRSSSPVVKSKPAAFSSAGSNGKNLSLSATNYCAQ
uniref:Uncharacterized protein n=1 Tax=Knipowitschia caucasica TaxID=637954 RepID=A0AAV2LM95_KNICA